MVTITGVATSLMEMLKGIVPIGVDPIYFFATFLIMFSILFVVLQLIHFFKDSKFIAFIVAAVISYFAASSAFVTIIVAKLFPNVGLVIMAILGLLIVVAFVSPDSMKSGQMSGKPFIIIVAFIIIIYLTYSYAAPELRASGFISNELGTTISDSDMSIVIAGVIVIGIIYAIVSSGKPRVRGGRALEYLFGREPF